LHRYYDYVIDFAISFCVERFHPNIFSWECGEMATKELPRVLNGAKTATSRPLVTLSYAQSIDGCIAINRETRLDLSGDESLRATHQLRAESDAILVGIGTVVADNPHLTVRLVEGRNPRPIILDSHLRLPTSANVLKTPESSPIVATTPDHSAQKRRALERAGAKVICVSRNHRGWVDLAELMSLLSEAGIGTLMVEGGARVITSFLSNHMADRLVITISPRVVGGLHAIENPLVPSSKPEVKAYGLPRLTDSSYEQSGNDIIFRSSISWETA